MAKKKALDVDFDLDNAAVNTEKQEETKVTEVLKTLKSEEDSKRLTLDIPPSLHRKLKIKAMDEGVTMKKMIQKWFEEKTK